MRSTNFIFAAICFILALTSCEDTVKKDPYLTCTTNECTFNMDGGQEVLNFSTNTNWRANASESWCSLSQSSGNSELESKVSLVIVCQKNETYSERECTITINAGSISHSIHVKQGTNTGLFIENALYEVSEKEHTLDIKVQSNVEYSVAVDANCASWVSYLGTKGLNSSTVQIKVAENGGYDPREGKLTISAKNSSLAETISIKQGKNYGLFVSKDYFEVSKEEQIVEVEVQANVDYDIVLGDESKKWIKPMGTKALSKNVIQFVINENTSYDDRNGSITLKQKDGALTATIGIHQSPTYGLVVKQTEYTIGASGGTIEIMAESNLPIDVVIPESTTWLTKVATKGLDNHSVTLEVSHNMYSTKPRKANIEVIAVGSSLKQSVSIQQKGQEHGTYYIPSYGALSYILENYDRDTITVMKIAGYMNAQDFYTLKNLPQLHYLDFSEATCLGYEIPDHALSDMTQLKTVKIPSNILYIRNAAFMGCAGLEGDIYIPEGLIELGGWVFMYCNKLTGELKLPQTLLSIGYAAFFGCTGLTGDLILPDGITKIPERTFYQCTGFNGKLHLPKNLKELSGLEYCSNIIGPLELPEGLEIIGEMALYSMSKLQGKLTVPSSVKEIRNNAFSGCKSLTGEPFFLDSWTEVPACVYDFCSGLTGNIVIPNHITSIGSNAFRECSGLTGLTLHEGITSIGNSAFSRCTGLTGELIIPESVLSINDSAFEGCLGLNAVKFGNNLSYIGRYAFSYCRGLAGVLTIPVSVKAIDAGAFESCEMFSHIAVYWDTPIEYTDRMFSSKVPIEVPSKTGDKYKAAPGWNNHPIVER